MKTRNLLLSSLTAMIVGLSGIAQTVAKDTDIYLMAPQVTRDDSPNVLIILDNSGSMDTVISSTRPAYDSSIDYCSASLDALTGVSGAAAGRPSNCSSISGRIYWSFNSTPPSNSSSNWFDASKNYCLDSTSSFNSSGFYGSTTKVARWYGGGNNNQKGWKTLNNKDDSTITYVDCMRDSDATGTIDGQASNDGRYPQLSSTTAYTASGTAFDWASFTQNENPTLYTSNYMNYWNNSTLLVTKTRIDVAKDTVNSIIDANKSIRFGLEVFNANNTSPDGGRIVMRVDTMDSARRTNMHSIVNSLTASTFTPLNEAMWEAYRYYAGLGVTFGNPSPTQSPHQDSCAQNVANAACNNGGYYDSLAAGNSAYNDGTYISPFKYGCQTAYVIYVTDGDPTNDSAANSNVTSLTGTSCDGTSCLDDLTGYIHDHDVYSGLPGNQVVSTYTIGFGGSISASGLALLQSAATRGGGKYYNAEDSDQLSTALQGALTDILQVNTSFTSPSLSINAFNKLYNRDEVYFAFFKPSSSVAWDGNVKKFTLCNKTQSDAGDCTFGDIIDRNGDPAVDLNSKILNTAVSYWATTSTQDGANVTQGGSGSHIPTAATPRKVYTYTGSYASLSASSPATPFLVDTGSTNTLRSAAVADPTILGLTATATSTDVDELIKWMLSQDSYDQWTTVNQYNYDKKSNTSSTDARWAFADPLHSRPAAITFGFEPTLLGAPNPDKPIIKLFVGTNDGAMHMINSDSGAEEWVFIPKEMLKQQYDLSQGADADHIVGLDGTPSFWTTDINNDGVIDPSAGDKMYMFIGMRRGIADPATGRGNIYAFDITPAAKMTSQSDTFEPKLMWVIQGGAGSYTRLGQTWSRPTIARIRYACGTGECNDGNPSTDDTKSRTVLLFGGGYDPNQDNGIPAGIDSMGDAIFMADPLTGSLLWWASSDSGANLVLPDMQFSIPSDLTVIDTDGDGRMDRIYVGDTGGQIWRFDLAANIATGTNGSTAGYVFADVGCTGGSRTTTPQPCSATTNQYRRKIFYPPEVAPVEDEVFSSTSLYDLVTVATGDREDPLDILTNNLSPAQEAVHNRIYAFRDIDYLKGPPPASRSAITDVDLYDATANDLQDPNGSSYTAALAAIKAKKGWYIDLKESSNITLPNGLTTSWVGEKGLAKTSIFQGVLNVTTFTPSNDTTATATCAASEGVAKVYALNYLDGTAALDLNGDGFVERSVQIGGGIPSEVVVVVRPGGTTGLVNVSGGSTQVVLPPPGGPPKSFWHDSPELIP